MPPDSGVSGMAGSSHEPSRAKHLPERERDFAWVLGVRFWGLAPPADGAAGGVNHPCEAFPEVGGSITGTPQVKSMLWGKRDAKWVLLWGSTPPAGDEAGGVTPTNAKLSGMGGFRDKTPHV